MPDQILVTGGTGRLGRALVPRLLSAGHAVRVLSRRPPPAGTARPYEAAAGDLVTGAGLVGTIVHCATGYGRADETGTRSLVEAASRAGRPHLIYVSIVGVDRLPISYYRTKLACERLLGRSGLPWTVQRTTQFHDLVAKLFAAQRWLPAILVPAGVAVQPADVGDVADRLTAVVDGPPAGAAPDMGGPEVRGATDLARAYLRAGRRRRVVLPVPVPGAVFRGLREGAHLAPGHAAGRVTFEDFLTGSRTTGRDR